MNTSAGLQIYRKRPLPPAVHVYWPDIVVTKANVDIAAAVTDNSKSGINALRDVISRNPTGTAYASWDGATTL